jgi:hypothetical protein
VRFAVSVQAGTACENAIDHHRQFEEGAAFPPRPEGRGLHAAHPMNDLADLSSSSPRTVANTRRARPFTARTTAEFESRLAETAWFTALGAPSPWDEGCVRIRDWDDWPGPENALGEAFGLMGQEFRDAVVATGDRPAAELDAVFDRVGEAVMTRARAAVPFDPDEDAWHAPTQCVWDAAYTAGVIATVLACGRPAPGDLVELWNWYEAGHWPGGFAAEPGDDPGDRSGDGLAYPRRLLVY